MLGSCGRDHKGPPPPFPGWLGGNWTSPGCWFPSNSGKNDSMTEQWGLLIALLPRNSRYLGHFGFEHFDKVNITDFWMSAFTTGWPIPNFTRNLFCFGFLVVLDFTGLLGQKSLYWFLMGRVWFKKWVWSGFLLKVAFWDLSRTQVLFGPIICSGVGWEWGRVQSAHILCLVYSFCFYIFW
jgi:hypothetical protein